MHAPDTELDPACPRRLTPTDWNWMGRLSPECQLRLTFGRSLVRDAEGAAKQKPHAGICAGDASDSGKYRLVGGRC